MILGQISQAIYDGLIYRPKILYKFSVNKTENASNKSKTDLIIKAH